MGGYADASAGIEAVVTGAGAAVASFVDCRAGTGIGGSGSFAVDSIFSSSRASGIEASWGGIANICSSGVSSRCASKWTSESRGCNSAAVDSGLAKDGSGDGSDMDNDGNSAVSIPL